MAIYSMFKRGLSYLAEAIIGAGGLTVQGPVAFVPQTLVGSTTHTLAGALTEQISNSTAIVSAVNANDAVALPFASAATIGNEVLVITTGSAATPAIWPGEGATSIDGGAAGSPVTLTAAHRCAYFVQTGTNAWQTFLLGANAS